MSPRRRNVFARCGVARKRNLVLSQSRRAYVVFLSVSLYFERITQGADSIMKGPLPGRPEAGGGSGGLMVAA